MGENDCESSVTNVKENVYYLHVNCGVYCQGRFDVQLHGGGRNNLNNAKPTVYNILKNGAHSIGPWT